MAASPSPIVIVGPALTDGSKIREAAESFGCHIVEEVAEINARILDALGLSSSQVDPLPEAWEDLPLVKGGLEALRSVFRAAKKDHELWAIVDPSVNLLLPLYIQAFDMEEIRPTFAICAVKPRPAIRLQLPDEEVDSSGMREAGLWLQSTISALQLTQGKGRKVILYKALPELLWNALIGDQHAEQAQTDPADLKDLTGLPLLVARTYDCCTRASQNPEALQTGAFDPEIDGLWTELRGLSRMIRPSLLPDAPMMFFWREGSQTKQHEQMFSPAGTWQTLGVQLAAPPNSMIQVAPYHMPSRIWVRKAVWKGPEGEIEADLLPGPTGRVEKVEGLTRISVFGPAAILIQAPPASPAKLELEFYIQATETVLTDIITMLNQRLTTSQEAR